jgi:hypothetical protein
MELKGIALSRNYKFTVDGMQPQHMTHFGIDDRGFPWFECYAEMPVSEMPKEMKGEVLIYFGDEIVLKKSTRLTRAIEFCFDGCVKCTYSVGSNVIEMKKTDLTSFMLLLKNDKRS